MSDRREFAIYVSSTVEDLKVEREIAEKIVGEFGTRKTSYRAAEEGVVATCVRDVRACDLYVGILGQRYGYVPGGEDDPAAKSITEIEFDACKDPGPGRKPIPRLIFIKPTDHNPGIPKEFIDALSREKTNKRMASFLQRANGPTEVAFVFRSPDALMAELRIRVQEKATEFHSSGAKARGMLGGARHWRTRLARVAIAVTPGSDDDIAQKLRAHGGEGISVFELSPESPDYVADADRRQATTLQDVDRGFATAQFGCLLVTPASLSRLGAVAPKVETLIDMQLAACGRFALVCAGVAPEQLPATWQRAATVHIDAAVVSGLPQAFAKELETKIAALAPELSAAARLSLAYLILAPTRSRIEQVRDAKSRAFDAFQDNKVRKSRRAEFKRVVDAATKILPGWPTGAYADRAEDWCCFPPSPVTADQLVRRVIDRINAALFGSRERRLLPDARIVPRRYRVSDFVDDRFGSRRMIRDLRLLGCLIIVDELALLDPVLRGAAEELLSGSRAAIVSIHPFDPVKSNTQTMLGDFSSLRVGTLVNRFRVEHDPRCEVALNSFERVERWLRFVIPDLVAANDENEVQEALAAKAHLVLPGAQGAT